MTSPHSIDLWLKRLPVAHVEALKDSLEACDGLDFHSAATVPDFIRATAELTEASLAGSKPRQIAVLRALVMRSLEAIVERESP